MNRTELIENIAEALYMEYMRGRYYTFEQTWAEYKGEFPDYTQGFLVKAEALIPSDWKSPEEVRKGKELVREAFRFPK